MENKNENINNENINNEDINYEEQLKQAFDMTNDDQAQRIACAKKTSIGGQALMEGIMMRGPKKSAMAVRNPQGEIVLEVTDISTKKRPFITKIPIVRGVFNFVSSMIIGYKALMRSAEISGLEEIEEELAKEKAAKKAAKKSKKSGKAEETEIIEEKPIEETIYPEEEAFADAPVSNTDTETSAESFTADYSAPVKEAPKPEKKKSSGLTTAITIISLVLGVVLAVGLFFVVPDLIADWLAKFTNHAENWRSVFTAFIKIIILVLYMSLVCLMKDIRRTFEYHGAEHKTIFCYEAGLELTVENVRKQRRFHPRCGTSFLILMLIISIGVGLCINPIYKLITGNPVPTLMFTIIRFCLLPITMGIGYELIKLAGRHDNIFTRIISAPGMWLQRLTVKEPTDDMIECAIAAFKAVVPEDSSDKF